MQHESFDQDKFHVVTMISNPARFSRRYHLYHKFADYIKKFTPNLWTIELQLGDRPFVTDKSNPKNIQLRTWTELWHKENALNVGISRLPSDWETVAWIDADIEFLRPDWIEETLHQLQVYQIVQMFHTAIDLGPFGHAMSIHHSFMSKYIQNCAYHPETPYHEWHPGYSWAARREALDGIGTILSEPLISGAVCGASDRHMALALVGMGHISYHPKVTQGYKDMILAFQDRAEKNVHRDVGFVDGSLFHYWHGKKVNRHYWDRWQILVRNQFNPYKDLSKDSYGIWQLHMDGSHRMRRLRDELRHYARIREEDSIDI
jgi:hypothetical protein